MRIYSAVLSSSDLHKASIGLPIYAYDISHLARPKLRPRGWKLKTGHVGGARLKNSGRFGADHSAGGAATWDAHGAWFARLFEMDPCALIVAADRYDGRAEFHVKTKGKYEQHECSVCRRVHGSEVRHECE